MSRPAEAVGGPVATRTFKVLAALFAVGAAIILWRFVFGLGAVTALNDGYPWGLWIAFDVVTGTALACGGYAMAILVYVFNRGRYHPLVRPAVLTSALGYSIAGIGVAIDVGRWWNLPKVARVDWWNVNSILLEVALCIMAYVVVLWIELLPAFMEGWRHGRSHFLRRVAGVGRPVLERSLLWILAFGLLLPTMHQSSLGSLYLIAGSRLDPLWHTPMLPLLFLVSCVAMGWAAVVFESGLSSLAFRRPPETAMLARLSGGMVGVVGLYLAIRLGDLAWRGRLGRADGLGVLFLVECALFAVPAGMLLFRGRRRDLGHLFRAAMLIMLAGALYRFDVYLVAFDPGPGWTYFPSVAETLATAGLVALEVMAYLAIVKRYPILSGRPRPGHSARPSPEAARLSIDLSGARGTSEEARP